MSAHDSSPIPQKRPKLACGINDLADVALAGIFKHLPPQDRLLISSVCKRWRDVNSVPWVDITRLDLSSIPNRYIRAILRKCPNLRSVFALKKTFGTNELHLLLRPNLSAVRLQNCIAGIESHHRDRTIDVISAVFSEDLPGAPWEELVLHDVTVSVYRTEPCGSFEFPARLPFSLKRLHICGLEFEVWPDGPAWPWPEMYSGGRFLEGLERLQELECLILFKAKPGGFNITCQGGLPFLLRPIATMRNLRELCLGPVGLRDLSIVQINFISILFGLTRLEILLLYDAVFLSEGDVSALATRHASLRILVITGYFRNECVIPVRQRFPYGPDAPSLPLLHVFLSKRASEKIRFRRSPSDFLKVYPIVEPLPQFLERTEVKPIFEGVWIARQIKEAAKSGSKFFTFTYENDASGILFEEV